MSDEDRVKDIQITYSNGVDDFPFQVDPHVLDRVTNLYIIERTPGGVDEIDPFYYANLDQPSLYSDNPLLEEDRSRFLIPERFRR